MHSLVLGHRHHRLLQGPRVGPEVEEPGQPETTIRVVGGADRNDNKELLKMLWSRRAEMPDLAGYLETCIRLWLISPPESIVESMCSVLGEVFGAHRNLDYESTARELVIRWNGPEPSPADSVVTAARALLRNGRMDGSVDGTYG